MIRVLIVLSMFMWAGCTQQEETGQAETKLSDEYEYSAEGAGFLGYVTGREKTKFNPTKHYIISVETVGFKRKLKPALNNYTEWIDPKAIYVQRGYWDTTTGEGATDLMFWDFDGWQPILDITWADKEHLLVTPEEAEKLRKLMK